jgi:class 3 adenylate cyclase/tetratricopeptide (TPR) repeat protein
MLVCPSCGAENREGAKFCDSCGAPLAEAAVAREVRKVVTVLFCDVTGSTALGEQIDPESLRQVMSRYFETAKTIVERHGGTVEKFIGDAVMAVFGVPAVHEDDALRAVRAAEELRASLGELNDELERSYGTRLELRMGVNTGEVVTGTEERLATGDAVNVGARLEQAAEPGEVLLGEETHRLVRETVDAEPAGPVQAKGKAEPVQAFRLQAVREAAPRRHGAPMVGRERQRQLLAHAFATAAAERSCHLFTILGAAGVGKSRLADEFLRTLDGARVVRGRCLSYGEGISYWPVTEVVKQLDPREAEQTALAAILGDAAAPSSSEEIAWSFRKLLETRAAEQPLVVVFDDIHWGEPAFLDLVEHVADLSRDAPILLLCMARPELLDLRATWGGGKLNATNVLLEPLSPDEAGELIEALTDEVEVADDLRGRILESAGGNPLFVEEMVAMASESGGEIAVPPTIQALLAARLDQLEPAERGVLERGAVEGLVFHRGAVAALAPEEQQVDGRLVTLVRKDLVRPEQPVLADDEAYRFRHLLIRDTAYEALPKSTRATLHERFALWLEEHGAHLVELDEIVGYHLELAYRYRRELGPLDDAASSLATQAAERLLRSAERARDRGDVSATEVLLARATELLPEGDPRHRQALAGHADVLIEHGRFQEAEARREQARAAARVARDDALLARISLSEIEAGVQASPEATLVDALIAAERARAELERLGDEFGAIEAMRLIGCFQAWLGSSAEANRTWAPALERAERVSLRLRNEILVWILWDAWWGSRTAEEGIALCDECLARARGSGSKRVEAVAITIRGVLESYVGRFDEARTDVAAGRGLHRELGGLIWWAGTSMLEGDLELVAGNPEGAYQALTEGHEILGAHAESGYVTTVIGLRAQAALVLGREHEALELADQAQRLAQKDDFDPHARARLVRAQVLARRGDREAAHQLLKEATALIEPTDYVLLHVNLGEAAANIHRLLDEPEAERSALEKALSAAGQKGCVVAQSRIRARLGEA